MAAYTNITGNIVCNIRAYKNKLIDLAMNKDWNPAYIYNINSINAGIVTTNAKFDSSLYIPSAGYNVTIVPKKQIVSKNWTMSMWMYMNSVQNQAADTSGNLSYSNFFVQTSNDTLVAPLFYRGGWYEDLEIHNAASFSSWVNYKKDPEVLPLKTWSHIGVVKENNQVRVYVNGQLTLTGTTSFPSTVYYTKIIPINNRESRTTADNELYVDDLVFIDNQVVWSGNSIVVPTDYFTGQYNGPIKNRMRIPSVVNADSSIYILN